LPSLCALWEYGLKTILPFMLTFLLPIALPTELSNHHVFFLNWENFKVKI
jgi:hypothetical protein